MNKKLIELEKEIKSLEKSIAKEKASKFSCVECRNQHMQILSWLTELYEYECGKTGLNKEDKSIEGYMPLEDAISHTKDVINESTNTNVIEMHTQLLVWLEELQRYRNKK